METLNERMERLTQELDKAEEILDDLFMNDLIDQEKKNELILAWEKRIDEILTETLDTLSKM